MATPFTPRPASRSANLGLSQKQYTKVASTLASVRRNRQYKPTETGVGDAPYVEDVAEILPPRTKSRLNGQRAPSASRPAGETKTRRPQDFEQPSFLAESSFIHAPLNSRVPSRPAPSPIAVSKGKEREREGPSLIGVPVEIQDALLCEDLLFVLMGVPGVYVTIDPAYDPEELPEGEGTKFVVNETADSSLRDLVERVLPLATYYTSISTFIQIRSPLENGLVNHALCAAIREMLHDYLTLVSQLEHMFNTSPEFSLQKLWFYVQPTLHTLSLVHSLSKDLLRDTSDESGDGDDDDDDDEIDARDAALGLTAMKNGKLKDDMLEEGGIIKGGEVVTLLWEKMMNMSGDPMAYELYRTLFRKASIPYVQMLRRWTTTGHLKDPYDELIVKEKKSTQLPDVDFIDEYWEKRYTLRDGSTLFALRSRQAGVPKPRASGRLPGGACVPPLLEPWKHKILLAGKYLNVIRECGRGEVGSGQTSGKDEDDEMALDDERFYKNIEDAYTYANTTLLKLLVDDQQLIPRLRSLKYYYFLCRSAFISTFLVSARKELSRPSKSQSIPRLQHLYDLAISTSPDSTPDIVSYASDIKVKLESTSLMTFLTKVDGITGAIDEISMGYGMASGTSSLVNGAENKGQKGAKDKAEKAAEKEKPTEVLTTIDAFTLDYKVKFPLSLVMSQKSILRYQLIFRFLLRLKSVEQDLLDLWTDQKAYPWVGSYKSDTLTIGRGGGDRSATPTLSGFRSATPVVRSTTPVSRPPSSLTHASGIPIPPSPAPTHTESIFSELSRWKMRVIILRSRMLSFIQSILSYATFEVVEPKWRELEVKLGKVNTVDQLLKDHVDFLDTCLKACLLSNGKTVRAVFSVLSTCQRLAAYSDKMTNELSSALKTVFQGVADGDDLGMKKRWDFISKFEKNFNHFVRVYVDHCQFSASSNNTALLALVVRLDSVRASEGPTE